MHAEAVGVHPFTDGNGRTTRLLADLVFTAAQDFDPLQQYDWNVDKGRYIALLREYDRHRSVGELANFTPIRSVDA
ncbi:fic/DOC family protein [Mycobacterium kansasii 732]|nr:fic/DOC family protein [Mycobacterium kansasii 732]